MTHVDAWTGKEIEGQAAIVQTTNGPEVVDIRQVRVREDLDDLAGEVEGLRAVVEQLIDGRAPEPETKTAAKTSTAKAAGK